MEICRTCCQICKIPWTFPDRIICSLFISFFQFTPSGHHAVLELDWLAPRPGDARADRVRCRLLRPSLQGWPIKEANEMMNYIIIVSVSEVSVAPLGSYGPVVMKLHEITWNYDIGKRAFCWTHGLTLTHILFVKTRRSTWAWHILKHDENASNMNTQKTYLKHLQFEANILNSTS